ncbi:MAG: PAS domain S-box protein [Deltaproteobacteria bacterium]|nr:PAS domain S-box protein [Deltaproteobacteria bacterium]
MTKKNSEEERLHAILECSRLGTWEWHVQTGETRFDERWAEIVGYSLDELAPVSIKTREMLAHPDDLVESNNLLQRHFSGELPYYDFESRMKHKDGRWVWVHERGKVVSWADDGKPLIMLGSLDDIATEKVTEMALEESLGLFGSVYDSSPIGIAIIDPKSQRFLRANQGFLEIVEYTEDELLEKTIADITPPEDWQKEVEAIEGRLSGTGDDYIAEKRYYTKSGRIVHVLLRGNTFLDKEGNRLAVANVVDITEKKAAETKIEHLNRVLLAIRKVDQLITKERDRDKLIQGACDNLIETRGYNAAWIALHNESLEIDKFFSAGLGPERIKLENLFVSGKGVFCVEKCLSHNGVQVIDSPADVCGKCPLVNQYGNLSAMSTSLKYGETVLGILSVSIPATLVRDSSEQSLLHEVADDIAFALHNMNAEHEVKSARERECVLAEMLDVAPNSITIHDTDGKFLFANQKTFALHGYTRDEFMNINLHDLDVPESEALLAERFGIIERDGEARFDTAHYRKNGISFPLEVFAKKIEWNGKAAILSIATDITHRKETEEKLKASEQKFRILVENANDILYSISLDGLFTYVSPNWMQLMGEPAEEAVGKSFEPYVHPDDVHVCRSFLHRVLSSGEKQSSVEYRVRHGDGSWRWHVSNGAAVRDAGGHVTGYVGVARDETDKKQIEQSLRVNEEILTITSQMAKIGGWELYPETMEVTWTDETYRIHEVSKNVKPPLEEAINFWHPEDRPILMKAIQQALEKGIPYDLELRFITAKGKNLHARTKCHPVLHNGKVVKLQGFFQDITEAKHAQNALAEEKERLMVTLQSIGDGVITTDTSGNVVLLNKVAEQMTGWSSVDAKGRPLEEVFSIINEVTRKQCENPVARVLATGRIVELANYTALVARDKREIVIADSAAPIKNGHNKTIGVILVFRDITEKKKLESAVEVSSRLDSLGVLAGGIAHDFNNLLGGIYGYIDMAIESARDGQTSEYLSKTAYTIERARALTQQLLTFAKGGAPVQKIEPLFPFVKDTVQFALSGTNVSCDFSIQQDLWNCNYDRNQIGQVIDNLVINAQQAMPVGGSITVSAQNVFLAEKEHPLLAEGNYVKVSVQDKGVGIPRELLVRIFDPFFTTKTKGHGLGLATCYSIINRHGGCIDVYSEPGKGTVFHVYLPATGASDGDAVVQQSVQHKGSGTFLVMDDEEAMRDILKQMLESFGYSAVCAGNGKDAIAFLNAELEAKRPVAGMIFDLTVPGGMGGMEAIAELRKIDAKTPAFVASGYADGTVMKNPVEYGFTASIGKPFRKKELIEMLEKHMK